ncbi:hypothetical protein [Parachlamydia sp. AcF125]|uniref:hypothetical protein n=1 Tax=Parachlamydia sp. AcF125 TaxID=2795736 RepID=UPI001BD8E7A3|nr:hypothetical protein [Parachlamydia sp. AcF125]MBS4169066.1 hypothetical protein [Parachlamydia sp. AcF125]
MVRVDFFQKLFAFKQLALKMTNNTLLVCRRGFGIHLSRLRGLLFLFFLGICSLNPGEEVKVSAEIERDRAFAGQSLPGTVMITHNSQSAVDTESFMLDGRIPLKVQFQRTVKISQESPLVISVYYFTLDPQEKGLYVLPRIQVVIGGKKYQSTLSSYEVHSADASKPLSSPLPSVSSGTVQPETGPPILRLEAFVQGKSTLFPGERTYLVYRYIFNTDIELTKEVVPMLEASGMRKVGSKQIHDHTEGNFSIREILQEVEAVKPGKYVYGPSLIEGYAGRQKQLLKAQAPLVSVVVNALPQETAPKSFNGAIGDFTYTVKMLTPSKVRVGDKIQLSIQVAGKGDLSTVKLPDLCCQPGFEGLFSQSDLIDTGKVQGGTLVFMAEMRPLSGLVHEIPSIEFSSFNPTTQTYQIKRSSPIPLSVIDAPLEDQEKKLVNSKEAWNPLNAKPMEIEIQGNERLSRSDLDNRFLATWWSLLLIPVGIGLVLFQLHLKKHLAESERQPSLDPSEEILKEALGSRSQSDLCFSLLTRALLTRLVEKEKISKEAMNCSSLPQEGIIGEVKEFLMQIEKMRFSNHPKVSVEENLMKGKALFLRIK